ncbi:MAG: hypothetical protein AAF788_03260 [Pseudomonadota bacterium]
MRILIAACAFFGAFFMVPAQAMTYNLVPGQRGSATLDPWVESSLVLRGLSTQIGENLSASEAYTYAVALGTGGLDFDLSDVYFSKIASELVDVSGMDVVQIAFDKDIKPLAHLMDAQDTESNQRVPLNGTLFLMLTGMVAMAFARRTRSL